MSFKFTLKNNGCSFKVDLNREVSGEEFAAITQFASNILVPKVKEEKVPVVQSTQPPFVSTRLQSRLGEFPRKDIILGDYKEPDSGVRIRMLSLPDYGNKKRIDAIRALRENTKISIMACKEIVYGNATCPIIKPEVAQVVLQRFRELDVHAQAFRASKNAGTGS